jgi:peptidoglycan/LPS O-acetylase OafA/YrhL
MKNKALDGIRGFAILIVFCGHFFGYLATGRLARLGEASGLGVDLFFVLSGYLITSILLRSRDGNHYYRNFFGRRGLRIWPLYYAFLAFLAVVHWNLGHLRLGWYAIYAQALRYPAGIGPDPISVTWSLAIEEQFYLLWPFAVAALSRKRLAQLAWLLILITPAVRWFYVDMGANPYIGLACRWDALAMGALLALGPLSRALYFVPLVLLIPHGARYFGHGGLAAVFAMVISLALAGKFRRVFEFPVLRYFGDISYGLYLIHLPVLLILKKHFHGRLLLLASSVGLSLGIATLSRWYFEEPILKLKDRWFASSREAREAVPDPLSVHAS